MAYTNHLLFNNIFLKNLTFSLEETASARHLVYDRARDWYRGADFSSPARMAETWLKPLLNPQSLDLVPADLGDEHAWFLVAPWERENPLALAYLIPERANLDGTTPHGTLPKGQAYPIQAVNLARQVAEPAVRWVVLTNGAQWRLMDAQSLRRYEAFLEIDLYDLLNGADDPLAAALFHRLLRLEDSLERDETSGHNRLDAFLEQSLHATEQTERYLKTSVSDNLNTPGGGDGIMAHLCLGLVNAVDPTGKKAFTEQERAAIYRDATYLLYRLLFIFYAEARKLLPVERPEYQPLSLGALIGQAAALHADPGKGADQPTRLWEQLTALFNAIQFSDEYLGIPPYNGGLFEDKDKPYLAGYKIENQYLAEALYELAFLQDAKAERPPEPIDYNDLSVRHLGSLYEGMIEYRLFIAEEELLARRDKDGKVQYLSAAKTARKSNDEALPPGKVYFAQSPHERKSTGTHYTAEDLVERLARQTVLRLLDERWQAFQPQLQNWLSEVEAAPDAATRTRLQARLDSELEAFVRQQVLTLRICDPAMGSGHFLVHIAHLITNFILWALSSTPWPNPAVNLAPDYWRRQVVESCLYGVDINEMAVELAKLSLWLATMQLGRPLSFLDHHLKQGNSLLGAGLDEITALLSETDLNQRTRKAQIAEQRGQYAFRQQPPVLQKIEQANRLLEQIAARRAERLADIEQQEAEYQAVQNLLAPYKQVGDLLTAQKMGLKLKDADRRAVALALEAGAPEMLGEKQREILEQAQAMLADQRTFHWPLEFPQVFLGNGQEQGGFDAVVGNPPFLGGLKIRGELGGDFLVFLNQAYPPAGGTADLCAYVFRRAHELVRYSGFMGMVATNTIGQGDTRDAGLAIIVKSGKIIFADRFIQWPGVANVEVNLVALKKGVWNENCQLDGLLVSFISSRLDSAPESEPFSLNANQKLAFIGDIARGIGFILDPLEAKKLIAKDRRNAECVVLYLNGEDLNRDPEQKPSRYAICFQDWPLSKAAEYPDALKIVEERVKPWRLTVKEKHERENWWIFARYRGELREATSSLTRVLARSRIAETHAVTFLPNEWIFNEKTIVFAFDDYYHFSLLQSNIHELWMRHFTSTLRTDINYAPTDCFGTFPFPQNMKGSAIEAADEIGGIYHDFRQQIMARTQLGLTKTYNRFHNPGCSDDEIVRLRNLHAAMDRAILACYGWEDIDLQPDFYPNDRKKIRYMPSPSAQREIFTRLMALNQQIAAEERSQGLVVDTGEEETIGEEE